MQFLFLALRLLFNLVLQFIVKKKNKKNTVNKKKIIENEILVLI